MLNFFSITNKTGLITVLSLCKIESNLLQNKGEHKCKTVEYGCGCRKVANIWKKDKLKKG